MSVLKETWRVGRKVGRTLYRHADGSEDGELIGVLDTREAATLAAAAPELYRALERLRNADYKNTPTLEEADAALRKARGE